VSEEIAFTRADAERLAALDTKVDHLTVALGDATKAVTELTREIAALKDNQTAARGFISGARWTIGLLSAGGGALGMWLLKKFGG
jgi:hypothetical protein